VSFSAFSVAARKMGFNSLRNMWTGLDVNQSGFISLDEWDPQGLAMLMQFSELCCHKYGTLEVAFNFGLDQTKSATCTLRELAHFCDWAGFSGDVEALFRALDVHEFGFFTLEQLDFLHKWKGEKPVSLPQESSSLTAYAPAGDSHTMSSRSIGTAISKISTMSKSSRTSTRTQGTLQAMPEVAAGAAARRQRVRQRCNRPAENLLPTAWVVTTGGAC